MRNLLFLSIVFILGACGAQKYTAPNFEELTAGHETVAVLPVEMVFTGRQPKDLSLDDIRQIEEGESLAFQISLNNALLGKAEDKRIYFQEIDETNKLLSENDISIRERWDMRGDDLAEILGVDAVVKMRVEKQRYLSDLESFGIDLAQRIIHRLANYQFYPWVPDRLEKTNDVRAKASLVNGRDGKVLWNLAVEREADWNRPANEIINHLTRKMARNFPYD
jgi:hypothetical protein